MANGILDLDIDDNNQDENLFLSAPEQRGLEAATFATAIGAAPSTGSLFGDLLSVAAQTGPTDLATFKERQSIKEKEAEYKDKIKKKKSLSTKFVALKSNPSVPILVTEQQAYDDALLPLDQQKYTKVSEASKRVIDVYELTADGDRIPTKVTAVEYMANKDRYEIPEEAKTYYIYPKDDPSNIRTETLKKSDTLKYIENDAVVITDQEPPEYQVMITEMKGIAKDKTTRYDNAIKQYKATGQVVRLSNELNAVLESQGDTPVIGTVGDIFIGLEGLAGGISSGFSAIYDPSNEADKKTYQEAQDMLAKAAREYQGKIPDDSLYAYAFNPSLSSSEKAQKVKSLLTQLVYKIAKARESGGKFSVPDIQFAFESAGKSSAANILKTGLSVIVQDVVEENVANMKATIRELYPEKYQKTIDDPNNPGQKLKIPDDTALDKDLFIGGDKFGGLAYYQDVLKSYYGFTKRSIPKDWAPFDMKVQRQKDEEKAVEDFKKNYEEIIRKYQQ